MSDLPRLRQIADLRLDLRLARLRAAGEAVAALRAELLGLDTALQAARATDWLDPAAAERYEIWGMGRRRALNLALARAIAAQDTARDAAGQAFGQSDALSRLQARAAEAARMARARGP